jgi:hypothetical protein
VLLDGRRVGELTHRMAQRYGQLVDRVLAGGSRPGCLARVIEGRPAADGQRLLEVKLRLPESPVPPLPGPRSSPDGYWAGGHGPGRGPRPLPPSGSHRPDDRGRRRSRRPLWIAVGVGALLLVIGSTMGGDPPPAPPPVSGPAAQVAAAQPTTTPPASSAVVEPPTAESAVTAQAQAPAPRRTTAAAAPRTAANRTSTTASARPAPTTTRSTSAKAESASSAGGCDPNYSGGCVPIASDVDCSGGTGDGPKFVAGPVRVVGKDKYRLDDDKNGVGCE